MSFDIFKRVKFNDGEEVTQQDLNNIQDYMLARLYDQLVSNSCGFGVANTGGSNSPDIYLEGPEPQWAYCPNPAAAYLRAGSATNKVQLSPGMLMQRLSAAINPQDAMTGNAAQLVPYYFDGTTTYEWTIAAGAVNPRVDLLQMSLAYVDTDAENRTYDSATPPVTLIITNSLNKQRVIQCTLSVKQGTAAASPQIPDPDAGAVAVGMVVVNATYVTTTQLTFYTDVGGATAYVCDLRMPLRTRSYRVDPMVYKCVTAWALSTNNFDVISSNATNVLHIIHPGGAAARLVGMGVSQFYGTAAGGTYRICRSDTPGASSTLNAYTPVIVATGAYKNDVQHFQQIEATHTPVAGPTVLQSSIAKYGMPVWCDGGRGYGNKVRDLGSALLPSTLDFRVQNAPLSTQIGPVTFYTAEGI